MNGDDLTETQAKSILDGLAKRCGFSYVSHDDNEIDDFYCIELDVSDEVEKKPLMNKYLFAVLDDHISKERSILFRKEWTNASASASLGGESGVFICRGMCSYKRALKQMLHNSHDGYAIIFSNMSLSCPSLRNGVFLKPWQCLESILVELDLGVRG